jgi:hypothetical protein
MGDQRIIAAIVERIKPLLAGHPAELQGAGHQIAGDQDATRTLRAELLAVHCFAVRELTTVNANIMGTTP